MTWPLQPLYILLIAACGMALGIALMLWRTRKTGLAGLQTALLRQEQDRALMERVRLAVAREMDLSAVIASAVDGVADTFGYTLVSLYMQEGDTLRLQHQRGYITVFETIRIDQGVCGKVARTGRPLLLTDVRTDPDFLEALPGIVSEVCVPLFDRGQVVGVFNVESRTSMDEADLNLLTALAEHVSIALGRARLYAEMSSLYDTSLEINSQSDLTPLLEAVTRRAAALMGVESGGVYLLSDDGLWLDLVGGYNLPDGYLGTRLKRGEGLSGRVAETGSPQAVEDYRSWEGRSPAYPETPFQRVLAVPLIWCEDVIGVLNLSDTHQHRAFTADEIRLARLFADQAALSIQNARLLNESRQRAEELAVINRITQAVVADLELEQVLAALYDACRQVLPMDSFYAAVYDEKTGLIYHPFFRDGDRLVEVQPRLITLLPGLTGETILRRQTMYLPDTLEQQRAAHGHPTVVRTGGLPTRSYVGVPLIVRERVVGVLAMQSYQPNAYNREQIHLFETIAGQAASAIEHARLFDELNKTTRYLATLNEITRVALMAVDLGSLLQTLADRMGELFDADGCFITQWDEAQGETIPSAAYGPLRESYPQDRIPRGVRTMTESVLEAGRPLAAEDVSNSPYLSPEVARRYPAKSMLGLPLIAGGRRLGAALISYNSTHHFTAREIELGKQAADQVALALAKSQLAVTDYLTGAYNRRGLFELGKREVDRASRYGQALSAILLDIDHFKQVNDAHGHAVGDAVLRAVAERCGANIRSVDILGRYGGEEFAILLPESDLAAAVLTAERLWRTIGEMPVLTAAGKLQVTVSVGVASMNGHGLNLDGLLKSADDAMYAAKQAGRNRVVAGG